MHDLIPFLNRAGDAAAAFAGPAFLQSAVLIAVVAMLDRLLRRRAPAALRAALWLLVLVKLALPPSLALPTGVGYWLNRPAPPAPATAVVRAPAVLRESAGTSLPPLTLGTPPPRPAPRLRAEAWLLLGWAAGALALAGVTLAQWLRVRRLARGARPATPELAARLERAATRLGLRRLVRLRLADSPHGPLVFGVFRPVILLPERLAAGLAADQLDDVLLHELAHVRRGDLWTGHAQALLQILWWWHPLVWLAGRRLDRAREEAADETVLAALDREPPRYAETLVAVARLVTARPGLTLGFLGILERRSALRRRVERLLDGPAPRRRLGWGAALLLAAFAAAALPMSPGPARPAASRPDFATADDGRPWPDPRFPGYAEVRWEPAFYIADEAAVRSVLGDGVFTTPQLVDAAEAPQLAATLLRLGARPHVSAEPLRIAKMGGGRFHWRVGGTTNESRVTYVTREQEGFRTVVGAEVVFPAEPPDWTPVEATITTWSRDGIATELEVCEIEFRTGDGPPRSARSPLPPRSALVWAGRDGAPPGRCQLLVIQEESKVEDQKGRGQVVPAPAPLIQADGRDVSAAELQRLLKHGHPPAGANAPATSASGPTGAEVDAERAELAALRTRYPDRWPAVVAQEAHVAELERQLAAQSDVLEITVTEGSRPYVVNGQPLDRAGLVQALARRPQGPPNSVRLLADSGVPAGTLVRALGAAREADVTRVTVAPSVETPAKAAEPPPVSASAARPGASLDPAALGRLGTVTLEPPPVVAGLSVFAAGTLATNPPAAAGTPATNALFTRFYRLAPHRLVEAMRRSGVPEATQASTSAEALRAYFKAAGVEALPPKALFLNEEKGVLMARLPMEEMEIVQNAVEMLNTPPPLVQLETEYVTTAGVAGVDDLLGVRGLVVLPRAQAGELRQRLQKTAGVELLAAPTLTTVSGRQGQVQGMEIKTVVTPEHPQGQREDFGLVVDVVPQVEPDGVTLNLVVMAGFREFLGYEEDEATPRPRIRSLQTGLFTVVLLDGQTLLARLPPAPGGAPDDAGGLILITPTLVDPAGNRVHHGPR